MPLFDALGVPIQISEFDIDRVRKPISCATSPQWTSTNGRTATDGSYHMRGFYDDHEVTVTPGAVSQKTNFSISSQTGARTVTLR